MKDLIGNELKPGSLVQFNLPPGALAMRGVVKEVSDGGITKIGGTLKGQPNASLTPGVVKVVFEQEIEVDPRNRVCSSLICLLDPDKGEQLPFLPDGSES